MLCPAERSLIRTAVASLVWLGAAGAAHAQVTITRSTFSAAGGTVSAGVLELSSTLGQGPAGTAVAGGLQLDAGFWLPADTTPPCPADFNADGELNADDLSDYITCFFSLPPCAGAEFNGDGEVNADDLSDYITAFFTGCP